MGTRVGAVRLGVRLQWGFQVRRYRDGDVGRDVIHQGQNSDTEPMENGANGVM